MALLNLCFCLTVPSISRHLSDLRNSASSLRRWAWLCSWASSIFFAHVGAKSSSACRCRLGCTTTLPTDVRRLFLGERDLDRETLEEQLELFLLALLLGMLSCPKEFELGLGLSVALDDLTCSVSVRPYELWLINLFIAWLKFLYGQSVRFPASFLCLSFPAPFLYIARTKAVLTGLKAY